MIPYNNFDRFKRSFDRSNLMIRGLASFFDSDPEENLERWKVHYISKQLS